MVTEINQDPILEFSKKTAVVVFYASWCGDCARSMAYERALSKELAPKVTFYRMDAEKYEKIADNYWVENYPTYVFFRDGVADKDILVEPRSEEEVRLWLNAKMRS